ncbi:MAG: DJ-1/PfpI family protein [Gemmatimonadetes bacterium]|jgi:transcriptional regulator GlxA family with amidase domain|nr:DJ-1/PfpI family protein [Gemmatimonadota bacterium]
MTIHSPHAGLAAVTRRTVAVVLFDEVEVLDFAGPFEVFSVCGRRSQLDPFDVFTVSERGQTIRARNGLVVTPLHSFASAPRPDILLVPGGFGTRREMKNPVMLEWVAAQGAACEYLLSVCTGALVLACAGLLDGLAATTHHLAFNELRAVAPHTAVREGARIVDNGRVILSSGVSAGIDMSLHVVARLLGEDLALETARYMEYEGDWHRT